MGKLACIGVELGQARVVIPRHINACARFGLDKLPDPFGNLVDIHGLLVERLSRSQEAIHQRLKAIDFRDDDAAVLVELIVRKLSGKQLCCTAYASKRVFNLVCQALYNVVKLEVASRALAYTQKETIDQAGDPNSGKEIIGNAPAMQEVFRAIGRLSQSAITVLISGQSGSGKELVARALHQHSPRAKAPFVALNMAAIPKDLMESELFGHEKGSFTGAAGKREGRFEQANGGTLFLDEIGDMPHETQTRLLRVLAEGEFFRVGGATAIKTDVRVIAATHQDLRGLVAEGSFREDLYHRLNVIGINVPRLAERREDIPLLLNHFLTKAASELGVPTKELSPQVRDYLTALEWPGNVRQLENTSRWLTVMGAGNTILMSDLPPELVSDHDQGSQPEGSWEKQLSDWVRARLLAGETNVLKHAMPQIESIMMSAALEHTAGKKAEAAELLGWGRNTLTRKLSQLA